MTTKVKLKDYLDCVMDMRAMLSKEDQWHKGFKGLHCKSNRLDNALKKCTDKFSIQDTIYMGERLRNEITELFPKRGTMYVAMFNDHKDTTYEDVCLVLDAVETQLRLELEG